MPRAPRLSDRVRWSATPVPLWRRAIGWVRTLIGAGLTLLLSTGDGPGPSHTLSGPDDFDPRIEPDEPDQVLGHLSVVESWSDPSAAFPAGGLVTVFTDRVAISSGHGDVELPLTGLSISAASSTRRGRRRKAADTFWVLEVTGPGVTLSIMGRWLLLAHVGTLGGWPEPQ